MPQVSQKSKTSPTYLIFGAYGGIGAELARALAGRDAHLAISGRDPDELSSLADEISAAAFPADATDFAAVDRVVEETVERYGRLDGVVNCVGSVLLKPAHLTTFEEFSSTVATNLTSSFAILRSSVKPIRKSGGGSATFVSTAATSIGLPNHEAISAAKGGIDALVRSAAATYGAWGIRVNAISPGLTETPLTERITGNERARASSEAMHALGRIGSPGDVASALHWILSDRASWVTGQVVGVDGGLGRVRSS